MIWQAPPSEDASSKQVDEYMQRPVDKGLLTSSGSSGPPARRNNPTKLDTHKVTKKVQMLCLLPMCVNCTRIYMGSAGEIFVVSATSSQLETLSHLLSARDSCTQEDGKTVKKKRKEVSTSYPNSEILGIWEVLGSFGKFWEFLGNFGIS